MPTSDDMVAVLNLLDQMTSLLDLEMEADKRLRDEEGDAAAADAATEASESNGAPTLDSLPIVDRRLPCLDLLLSENIPSHVLATSRMPVC